MSERILVTGATGLVGANLLRYLLDNDYDAYGTYASQVPSFAQDRCFPYDFTSFEDCLKATEGYHAVFVSVTQNPRSPIVRANPQAFILPNLKMYAGLLEACSQNKVSKVVFVSTSTIYPLSDQPQREEDLDLNAEPYLPYAGVAYLNRYIEQLIKHYHQSGCFQAGILRPQSIYGPFDKFGEGNSNVIPALIKRALAQETPFTVWGDGQQVRDFIYVEDVAKALVNLLNHACDGEPYNISSGRGINIQEAAETILEVCGHPGPIVLDPSKPTAIPYRVLDDARYKARLNDEARTSFKDGLRKTVDWYQSQTNDII